MTNEYYSIANLWDNLLNFSGYTPTNVEQYPMFFEIGYTEQTQLREIVLFPYDDGSGSRTNISLNFTEIAILHSSDYGDSWVQDKVWTRGDGTNTGTGNNIPQIGFTPSQYNTNGYDTVSFEYDGTYWNEKGVIKYFEK